MTVLWPRRCSTRPTTATSRTLADDGDPLDVLVITPYPVQPGSVIRARAVGVLHMEDEAGGDAKLLAVPHQKLTQLYNDVNDINDVPELLRERIKHFFENYKDLEKGKWVKVQGWGNAEEARPDLKAAAASVTKKELAPVFARCSAYRLAFSSASSASARNARCSSSHLRGDVFLNTNVVGQLIVFVINRGNAQLVPEQTLFAVIAESRASCCPC